MGNTFFAILGNNLTRMTHATSGGKDSGAAEEMNRWKDKIRELQPFPIHRSQ